MTVAAAGAIENFGKLKFGKANSHNNLFI
jgi:hypothetical protein